MCVTRGITSAEHAMPIAVPVNRTQSHCPAGRWKSVTIDDGDQSCIAARLGAGVAAGNAGAREANTTVCITKSRPEP